MVLHFNAERFVFLQKFLRCLFKFKSKDINIRIKKAIIAIYLKAEAHVI